MRQRRCTDSMAVSSTPPMNGEELQAAGRSPAVQLTIVGTRPEAKSLFQFCQVFFEGGRAALVGVVCVVVTGIASDKIISMHQVLRM